MTDYTKQVHIAATPERVFEVLTSAGEYGKWWTPGSGSAAEGGELRLTFDGIDVPTELQVAKATPRTVMLDVLDGGCLPEWTGTRPVFELAPAADGGCDISFRHEGLRPGLACYDNCEAGWNQYLPSLRDYIETGTGNPFTMARLG